MFVPINTIIAFSIPIVAIAVILARERLRLRAIKQNEETLENRQNEEIEKRVINLDDDC